MVDCVSQLLLPQLNLRLLLLLLPVRLPTDQHQAEGGHHAAAPRCPPSSHPLTHLVAVLQLQLLQQEVVLPQVEAGHWAAAPVQVQQVAPPAQQQHQHQQLHQHQHQKLNRSVVLQVASSGVPREPCTACHQRHPVQPL